MTIYLTMTLAVVAVELMHRTQKKYPSVKDWMSQRWDNLLTSFTCGVLLCMSFPEVSTIPSVQSVIDLHEFPMVGGLIIGLSSTPLINFIMTKTKGKIADKKSKSQD